MATGGRRRGPSGGNYGRQKRSDQDIPEVLASEILDCEDKTITLEMKSNSQGKFLRISENRQGMPIGRGHVTLTIETCAELQERVDNFVAEYKKLGIPSDDISESITHKTDNFKGFKSRRLYYIDLRENSRGRFLKLTMITDEKKFIAIPGEALEDFQARLKAVFAKHPPVKPADSTSSDVPGSRSIVADRKTFYLNPEKNERGVFVKITEVLSNGYQPGHLNLPAECWDEMASILSEMSKELPEESSTNSDDS